MHPRLNHSRHSQHAHPQILDHAGCHGCQRQSQRTVAAPLLTSYMGLPLQARSSLGARRKNSSAKKGPMGTPSPRSSFRGKL